MLIAIVVVVLVCAAAVVAFRGVSGPFHFPWDIEDSEEFGRQRRVADASEALISDRRDYQRRVKESATAIRASEKKFERRLKAARAQLSQAEKTPMLGYAGQIKVYEDRILTPEGVHPMDEHVQATVDTAGNIAVTRRHTLTRFALLGPVSLFTPKATKHDDRELYFLIEHPQWASMAKLNPDHGAGARRVAMATNLAARNVKANKAKRDRLIREAREELRIAQSDRSGILSAEAAQQAVFETFEVIERKARELQDLVSACSRQGSRVIKRAQRLLERLSEDRPRHGRTALNTSGHRG